jgi:hypothetical protein
MAAQQWWVIVGTSYGNSPSYSYFQGTQEQATAKSKTIVELSAQQNLFGPYATEAAAQAAVKGGTLTAPTPGGGGILPAPPGIDTPASGGASNPLSGLAAIGAFFSNLGQAATWEKVGEVVLGLILIAVGVARLTHAVPIATSIAKTAGAVAV